MQDRILNDRYQLLAPLNDRGTRQTFRARDLETDAEVVVKVLLFGYGFRWQDHKLFQRGADVLKTLSHPRIPQYLDYFDLDAGIAQGFAQVQTYIPARSLQQHLDAGRTFSEAELRQLAAALLEISIYLHERAPAVVHRDIKPENILLGDRSGNRVGEVYLVDFDSVQTHGSAQPGRTMTVVGTYGYMAPEQFGGQAHPATDLYGLGMTLVAIAAGKPPSDLPQRDLRVEFAAATQLSPEFARWLRWLTEPGLDRRARSAREALQALTEPTALPLPVATPEGLVPKPDDSLIRLQRDRHEIHIAVPPLDLDRQRGNGGLLRLGCFIVGLGLAALPAIVLVTGLVSMLGGQLVGLVLVIVSLVMLVPGLLCMAPLLRWSPIATHLSIRAGRVKKYKQRQKGGDAFEVVEVAEERISLQVESRTLVFSRATAKADKEVFRLDTPSVAEAQWLAAAIAYYSRILWRSPSR